MLSGVQLGNVGEFYSAWKDPLLSSAPLSRMSPLPCRGEFKTVVLELLKYPPVKQVREASRRDGSCVTTQGGVLPARSRETRIPELNPSQVLHVEPTLEHRIE